MTPGRRVRVVVVNYNGGELTVRSLEALRATDWPPDQLELVLVDNDSSDGIAARVSAAMPDVRVIRSGSNRGFAGGCNLGLRDLGDVDYVALVNSDAQVEPGWLAPLVAALDDDPAAGAACPKILFDSPFVELTLEAPTRVRGLGDRRELGVRLSGARVDGRDAWRRVQLVQGFWGLEHGPDGQHPFQWTTGRAHLRVPAGPDGSPPTCALRLDADEEVPVVLSSGPERVEHVVTTEPRWYDVPIAGEPFDVVNNVGSVLLADAYGADRGYFERDTGQHAQVEEVFAWCGAAVLLAREYLESVGLFEERFFLYYEDFDLAWRGRAQGWRHLFVPGSVVRHVHSASSVEGSPLFSHYVERNRLLTLARNAPLGLAARASARHLLITASYARRDVLSPIASGRPPAWETVRRRLRSLGAFARLLPPTLVDRRRLRAAQQVDDAELLGWMARR